MRSTTSRFSTTWGRPRGEGTWFYQTDVQFSVVAVLDDIAVLSERVRYDAYGRARHRWPADLDGDGDSDSGDHGLQLAAASTAIHASGYTPDADHDRDGDVDTNDYFSFLYATGKSALPLGLITSPSGHTPSNPIGYDGYVFAPEAGIVVGEGGGQAQAVGAYCVRFRWYVPEIGRWLQRDPAGYVDGMNRLEYARSWPTVGVDATGLASSSPQPTNTPDEPTLEVLGPGLRWTADSDVWMRRLETALRKLCPGAALVNSNGELILRIKRNRDGEPLYDDNDEVVRERVRGVPVSDEPGVGIEDCGEESAPDCGDPPGCKILRELANAEGVLVIRPAQPRDRRGSNRNVFDPRSGEVYWPGIDPTQQIRNLDGSMRGARAWEVLWHELVHAHRHSQGTYLGPDDPNEEVETIDAVNSLLYDWYRRCSPDKGASELPDRDPHSH